jgi:type IV pilus assembly protein PilE
MERRYTETGAYTGAAGTSIAQVDTGAPWVFSTKSPVDGKDTYYNLTIQAASATTYTLYAIPAGTQIKDKCGTLTLTNVGTRGIVNATPGVVVGDCW